MTKFRLSKAAETDLRKIAKYTLANWGEPHREAYIREFFDAFSRLSQTPQIATKIDAIREGYRKFPQGSHIIFFRECRTHNIEIIRILHKRMDVDSHLPTP